MPPGVLGTFSGFRLKMSWVKSCRVDAGILTLVMWFPCGRTSGDVRASYGSVVGNLLTTVEWAQKNLSKPGCWAYPDMLEVLGSWIRVLGYKVVTCIITELAVYNIDQLYNIHKFLYIQLCEVPLSLPEPSKHRWNPSDLRSSNLWFLVEPWNWNQTAGPWW